MIVVHGSYTDNIGDDVIHRGLQFGLQHLGISEEIQYINGRLWDFKILDKARLLILTGGQLMDWEGEAGHFPLKLLTQYKNKLPIIGWDFGWNRDLNQRWTDIQQIQFEEFIQCMNWVGMRTFGDYKKSESHKQVLYFPFPSLLPVAEQATSKDTLLLSLSNHTPYSSYRFTPEFLKKLIALLQDYDLKWFQASTRYEPHSTLETTGSFEGARLLITNRTHLTVEAVRHGVPVLLVPYNVKSHWAAETLRLPMRRTCSGITNWVNTNWEYADKLQEVVVQNREELRKVSMSKLMELKKVLDTGSLK
jgi:hypothetical protein